MVKLHKNAQHSPASRDTLRAVKQLLWLEVGSGQAALSQPAQRR
jgi:hypothetical protein